MKNKTDNVKPISRRGLLPLLVGSLLVPFLGMGKSTSNETVHGDAAKEDYQTLLKPDGTVVRVKKKTVQHAKVVEKDLSNTSLLNWLDKKTNP